MGVRPKAVPVSVINAVIDLDLVPNAPSRRSSDDVIELS
jgi:hypothetical protein